MTQKELLNQLEPCDCLFNEDDFLLIKRTPFYFGPSDKPLLGWLHTSERAPSQDKALIVCPPLALEYMNSYRSMRYVADYFALAGISTLRFDFHGTGDSSGCNLNEDRTLDWLESIKQAHQQLKLITGYTKIGLFGLRMGATLGSIAAEKIAFDFLVLWAPVEKGRRYIREIKALQLTSVIKEQKPSSRVEAGGTVYWQKTEEAISRINLSERELLFTNILIIPQDDLSENTKLLDCWKARSLSVQQISLRGSSDMLIDAHKTIVPHQSIARIVHWVKNELPLDSSTNRVKPNDEGIPVGKIPEVKKCLFKVESQDPEGVHKTDSLVEESFFYFGKENNYFAIKSESSEGSNLDLPIILLTNSGTNHRVGPSRLYVQLARQLSGFGFVVIRVDLPGIGDSIVNKRKDENIEYIDQGYEQIIELIRKVSSGRKESKFVVSGLCSGAYFSFHTALNENSDKIVEALMINPLTFYWETGMTADTSPAKNFGAWNWYKKALLSVKSWKKILGGKANYSYLLKTIYLRMKVKLGVNNQLDTKLNNEHNLGKHLEEIADKGTQLSFIFSRSDPGYDLLTTLGGRRVKKLIKKRKITMKFIENADHTFSKFEPRTQVIDFVVKHLLDSYAIKNDKDS